jgi:cupin domain
MLVRRVVTGHDASGTSVFISDDLISPTSVQLSSTTYHEIWRADTPPTFPSSGENGAQTTFFPGPGGYRFFILTLPPGDGQGDMTGVDLDSALGELEEKLPGVIATHDPDNPGMHTTNTVDMEIVLEGEFVLKLDDGAETTLRVGDVNIQNGTRHRWHNRTSRPARMAVVLVGGTRS